MFYYISTKNWGKHYILSWSGIFFVWQRVRKMLTTLIKCISVTYLISNNRKLYFAEMVKTLGETSHFILVWHIFGLAEIVRKMFTTHIECVSVTYPISIKQKVYLAETVKIGIKHILSWSGIFFCLAEIVKKMPISILKR